MPVLPRRDRRAGGCGCVVRVCQATAKHLRLLLRPLHAAVMSTSVSPVLPSSAVPRVASLIAAWRPPLASQACSLPSPVQSEQTNPDGPPPRMLCASTPALPAGLSLPCRGCCIPACMALPARCPNHGGCLHPSHTCSPSPCSCKAPGEACDPVADCCAGSLTCHNKGLDGNTIAGTVPTCQEH